MRLEKAQPSDNSLEKEKKSILSILILIAIYTYYKGKKIKIYNLSLQYVQFITSLSRPYIVLDLWWNQSTVKLFITLPRINKNQEKYVTSNFISSFHIFTFIVRFCIRSSNDVDASTKFLMETRKTQPCCHRNTRLAEKCFIVSRYNGSCSKVVHK